MITQKYGMHLYKKLVSRTFILLSCMLGIAFMQPVFAAGKTGEGRPVSECKIKCDNFVWRDHRICAKPDKNNEATCPLEVAIQRGYSEDILKTRFKGSFSKSSTELNKGDYFFREQNDRLQSKPDNIKITAWLDINNDGKMEVVGRKLHPEYMSVVGTKYGNGNARKGENLYDVIDIYMRNGTKGWKRAGAIDNNLCVHARRVLPGDYNNDGFIDVVFSCHGFDNKPFPGSYSVLYLNNADGTFTQKKIGAKGYSHAATSEDFNGDGFIDLLFYDANKRQAVTHINQGNGSFKVAQKKYLNLGWSSSPKYYVIGAVDANGDGKFDLVASGQRANSNETIAEVFLNDGTNSFSRKSIVTLPQIKGYSTVNDIYALDAKVYVLRSSGGSYWKKADKYAEIIQRYDMKSGKSEIIFEYSCNKSKDNNCGGVFEKLHLLKDKKGKHFLIGENTSFTKFGEKVRIK